MTERRMARCPYCDRSITVVQVASNRKRVSVLRAHHAHALRSCTGSCTAGYCPGGSKPPPKETP